MFMKIKSVDLRHMHTTALMRRCLFMLILVLVMTACSQRKGYVIGVSQCSEDIWRDKLNDELRMGTYLFDNVELRIASANDDDQRQIAQIDSLVASGIDLLFVSPNQMNTVSEAIDRAYDRGIPVIYFDRKTNSDKYTAFIGADNYAIGRTMGHYLATQLGGKGRVVEITGLKDSSPAIERHRGFTDELKAYPGIRLVCVSHGSWTRKSGEQAMNEILSQTDDFDCVFAQNDRMVDGARDVMSRKAAGRKVTYIGVDALPMPDGGMHRVKDGTMLASYLYPTRGDLVMQLAMNILEGKPYKRENYLQSAIVTPDNVDAMLMQADEMAQQRDRLEVLHKQVDRYLVQYNHQKVFLLLSSIIIALLIVFFIYIYRTIIMKRRLAEETVNAKLQFFTNVSHEFRTPLTLIADPVDRLLADPKTSEEQRRLLQLVRKNVSMMLRLVGEILDFRKVQNGKMNVEASSFDLAAGLREWTGNFGPVAQKNHIAMNTSMPETLVVCTDRNKVERICYNLMSNAMKYTPEGGCINVSLAGGEGGSFTLAVADTGIGIPADKLPHVFDRFYQVKHGSGGTGIGLALVKSFVDLLGGTVRVNSSEGRGAEFVVSLPAAKPSAKENQAQSGPEPDRLAEEYIAADSIDTADAPNSRADIMTSPDDDGEREEILVVDDNDDMRKYIGTLLSDRYNVSYASNGREGLDKAVSEVPGLIVCDVMMPEMDGLEMCRRIKTTTATSHIPVILLTANAMDTQRADGYDCGADAYIVKPFSGKVLTARVRNLIESRRQLKNIYAQGETDEAQPESMDKHFMNEFRAKVNEHLADPELNVETLSAELGLSRVQMYRKVKALTGSTPVELIRITRLKRADKLLKAGGHTVSEVSYEVGFSSPSYFSKCYKDYFGHTPNGK